jgi:hypothetical protein
MKKEVLTRTAQDISGDFNTGVSNDIINGGKNKFDSAKRHFQSMFNFDYF